MTRKEVAELWLARINDYRASGERVATWCERHQVTARQLWYYMRKLKQAEQPAPSATRPRWVPLQLDEPAADGAPPPLVRVGAAVVEVRAGFDPDLFTAVIKALQTLC